MAHKEQDHTWALVQGKPLPERRAPAHLALPPAASPGLPLFLQASFPCSNDACLHKPSSPFVVSRWTGYGWGYSRTECNLRGPSMAGRPLLPESLVQTSSLADGKFRSPGSSASLLMMGLEGRSRAQICSLYPGNVAGTSQVQFTTRACLCTAGQLLGRNRNRNWKSSWCHRSRVTCCALYQSDWCLQSASTSAGHLDHLPTGSVHAHCCPAPSLEVHNCPCWES